MSGVERERAIRSIVKSSVRAFADGFSARHIGEADDPNGTINMKVHNVFIAVLGEDLQYYTALVRSFDSSLGNMLEGMAINIAELSYEVKREVEGPLSAQQTGEIARLLEGYKRRKFRPNTSDYQGIESLLDGMDDHARHDSDYYLIDEETGAHYLIELKIGGDLDNKKARSEKEALLEQFTILANKLGSSDNIHICFATAYNRFGEGQPWKQERVRQFFADDELLIGKVFWDFVTKSGEGYELVLDEYKKNAHIIRAALEDIKNTYLH